ncbi:MAG: VOC family protein [Candidatus Thiodiazotropha sp. (ex Monitilora ramsayi)]|nr:VOC family protein [Candidatus Thiodiazotropha sp. (ex Monitilora ramsayi)]
MEMRINRSSPRNALKFFSSILLTFTVIGCTSLELSPVTEPATYTHQPGKIVWHDLLTHDVESAKKFYGELLGWTFRENGDYHIIQLNGRPIGGIVEIKPKSQRSIARWITSLSVDDVDKSAEYTLKQGGKIHEGPVDMRLRGRGALVSDPLGAKILLLHSSSGDPEDRPATMNDWLWDELWSSNPDNSLKFYSTLVGYTSQEMREGYWILKSQDKWRSGIRSLFDKELEQRWVPVIRVENPQQLSVNIEKLGGSVLIATGESATDSQTALLADPAGALFMIQHWSGLSVEEGK